MWMFYLISLPLTMGMVVITLKYFAGPYVPRYVLFTVGYTWFCSLSIIILVPADIWTTIMSNYNGGISFLWSLSYWSTFLLTWVVVPTIQGYEDAGDFTMTERLKTSIHANLVFYLCIGAIGLFGLILLILLRRNWSGGILGLAMACSNTFGLVTGAFLLGFGLSEIPKGIWKNADWTAHQKLLTHKVAKMAVKLDDAHQEFSNSIVIAQATSKQMSKRDPLRPYMNIIDDMLFQMLKEDTSFKPQGGRLGENDMDYDTDEKSMATLRRQLRRAREEYYRYRSEYTNFVLEALELEDTMKNNEHCNLTGWRYISSFRPERSGTLGSLLDMIELMWRCILRKQLQKLLAIILGCMSAAILLAEATILPSGVDLSLFSILINAVGRQEVLVQVAAFIPLMYMCMCTYYSLFKIGMLMFYSLTPRQTSSVSLLMICSMVARYAPPISYNFLNLIRLDGDEKTIFEQIMGNIDDAVPFFGKGFNKIYPLIMVIYTLLIASNFFDRVIEYFGNWKIFKFQNESDDMDGFDQSGVIILKKERSGLEQGHTVGEHVIPLARNFNNVSIDVESWSSSTEKFATELKSTKVMEDGKRGQLQPLKEEALVDTSREHNKQASNMDSVEKNVTSSTADSSNLQNVTAVSSSRIASKWEAVKNGFQNFKSNIDAKRFIHLRQIQETKLVSNVSSSESLDEIFQRLKQPTINHRDYSDDDDDDYLHDHGLDIRKTRPSR
ncbi:LMBR1 domain-containing protein 2 homolog A-like isoform X1 [Fagus crenata]